MKLKQNMHKQITGVALVALLAGLPGCNWFSGTKETTSSTKDTTGKRETKEEKKQQTSSALPDDVIVTINDKPLITLNDIQREKNDLIAANPQYKEIIEQANPAIAKQLERHIAGTLVNQAIAEKYITDNKIDQTKEYKEDMERMKASIKHALNGKFFDQSIKAEVTDAEAKEFYEQNKNTIPQFLLSHGGVKAVGVEFDTQDKAQAFAKQVNEQKGNFQKAAELSSVKDKVKDFNLVHDQSIGLNTQLRDKIVALKKVPAVEVIKLDDTTFWVVQATEKQEPKYQPFDSIKADIVNHLEEQKRRNLLQEKIKQLHDQYKVVVKEEYFAANEQDGLDPLKTELIEASQE